jgi:hypothetical protein
MSNPKTIWLHLVSQGGRWTSREIHDALPELDTPNLSTTLQNMQDGQQIVRYPGPEWGVTANCRPPKAVTLADIIAAGVVLPKVEA